MSFASQIFWLFAVAVFLGYCAAPARWRWVLMLIASYAFYAYWDWRYVPLLFGSTAVDYYCVHRMARHDDARRRKPWLLLTLTVNLGVLFFFKYWNFAGTNLNSLFGDYVELHELLLPLGISFYTFQTLSYSLDAYHGRLKPEPHFGYFCLFVSFFPQLVAGPIERSQSLLPQLKRLELASKEQFRQGALLIMWGLMLKLVIADNLTQTITAIYFDDGRYAVWIYWLAGALVSFKIYCDFMAYSEIARGLALLFGVKLTKNFRRPFLASSIHDFWQRWHVSLTRWIGAYIAVPLMKRYPKEPKRSLTSVLTMTLIGLWHGASWNFILFGLYHGILLVVWNPACRWTSGLFKAGELIGSLTARLVLLFVWITGSTMFFVADFDRMGEIFRMMFLPLGGDGGASGHIPFQFPLAKALFGLLLLTAYSLLAEHRRIELVDHVAASSSTLRWLSLLGLAVVTLLLGNFDVEDFIYFEF